MKIYTDNVFCLARKKSFCTFRETLLKHWNLLTHPVDGGKISTKWKYFISDEIEKCKWEFLMEIPMEILLVGFRRRATRQKRIPNSNQVIQFFAIQISPALFSHSGIEIELLRSLTWRIVSGGFALQIQGGVTFRTLIEKWSAKASITMINYIKDRVVPASSASSLSIIFPGKQFEY